MNVLRSWRKRIEAKTAKDVQEGRQAAKTGDARLAEVRKLTGKSAEVRKKSQQLKDVNNFAATFLRALEEGLR